MILEWWQAFVRWLGTAGAQELLTTVVLPFVAILTAGLLAVLIARASSTRLMHHRDKSEKAAAIAGLLAVCRRVTVWTSLSSVERDHLDYQITESTVRLRLLPIGGADLAAEWSQAMIVQIKRNSAALIDEAERGLTELENGLILWYRKPRLAKKQFTTELPYLRTEVTALDHDLVARQKQWQASQDGKSAPIVPATSTSTPAPASTDATAPFGNIDELIAGAPTVAQNSVPKAS